MASFAGDSGKAIMRIENIFCGGRRYVATEAAAGFLRGHGTAERFFQIRGHGVLLAWSDVQGLQRVKITDVAFKEFSIFLIDEGLPHVAGAEGPEQVGVERRSAIGDAERAGGARGRQLVAEGGNLK